MNVVTSVYHKYSKKAGSKTQQEHEMGQIRTHTTTGEAQHCDLCSQKVHMNYCKLMYVL